MRVYYVLTDLDFEDYKFFVKKFQQLETGEQALEYCYKHYKKAKEKVTPETTGHTGFIELMTFVVHYLNMDKSHKISDINLMYYENWIYHNGDFYKYQHGSWDYIANNIMFVTTRGYFNIPFFRNLYRLQSLGLNKNFKIVRSNFNIAEHSIADKLNNIGFIGNYFEEYIGDLAVPLMLNSSFEATKSFLLKFKDLFGDKFVIKKIFGDRGKGVKLLDTSNLTDDMIDYIHMRFFQGYANSSNGFYVVPYYDIETEFRIYYIKKENNINIYSIKTKNNLTENIQNKPSFDITKHLSATWDYCDIDTFKDKEVLDAVRIIADSIPLNCGIMELCRLKNGEIRFLEINPLGGSMSFKGKDEEMILKFYFDLRDKLM